MTLLSIIFISLGLAMDCFSVSLAKGVAVDVHEVFAKRQHPWLMAVLFGLFQGGMPLIGYFLGTFFTSFFDRYAPWIAFCLLVFIGGKMLLEGLHTKPDTAPQKTDFSLLTLLTLAVATSIDALATGVIFIPVPERLWLGVSIIALGSFILSMIGYLIGVFVGTRFHFRAEILGGVILIGLGTKILIESFI